MTELLERAEEHLRKALEEINATLRVKSPGAEVYGVELDDSGELAISYIDPTVGTCAIYVAQLTDACDGVVRNATRLRERRLQRPLSEQVRRRFTTSSKVGECVLCHSTDDIHEHHIRPRSKYPELEHEKSNIVPLCAPCHRKTYGREEQYIAVIEAAVGA